jgi:hypothetical protein
VALLGGDQFDEFIAGLKISLLEVKGTFSRGQLLRGLQFTDIYNRLFEDVRLFEFRAERG